MPAVEKRQSSGLKGPFLSGHRVQFCKDEQFLASSVADHLAGSLQSGGSAFLLATPAHGVLISNRLAQLNIPRVSRLSHCIMCDASGTLSSFMRTGLPDAALFSCAMILQQLKEVEHPGEAQVSAFGEMVAVLWSEGQREAAVKLEQLWNEFVTSNRISLLCAYPLSYFSNADDGALFMRVCAEHSSVLPAESFLPKVMEDQQARELADLQQRAEALAREVEARKLAEERSRAVQAKLESMVEQRTNALRELTLHVLKVQDIERRRIARELHDSVGQDFSGLEMNLELAKRWPQDSELWKKCDELLEHCIEEVRTLSNLLHPPLIEEAGFGSAAEWYVQDFARRSGIHVTFEGSERLAALDDPAKLVLFRALQQRLINVHRHAAATRSSVRAECETDCVIVTVEDNRTGIPVEIVNLFNTTGTGMGVGLTGIWERVRDLQGTCELNSSSQSTEFRILVPATQVAGTV